MALNNIALSQIALPHAYYRYLVVVVVLAAGTIAFAVVCSCRWSC